MEKFKLIKDQYACGAGGGGDHRISTNNIILANCYVQQDRKVSKIDPHKKPQKQFCN